MGPDSTIAFFVTPHGFGHAGRASALMLALQEACPGCRFVLFTTVPEFFFFQSGIRRYVYHRLDNDIGLVQHSPLEEDLKATCHRLDRMLPFDEVLTSQLASQLKRHACRLVICDIAAMGIVAASKAAIPSVLVENFTWDWIYGNYSHLDARFNFYQAYLAQIYTKVDHHIQTEPLCRSVHADLTVGPISREPRTPAEQTRRQLGIGDASPIVLVSMGGVKDQFQVQDRLPQHLDFNLLITGADGVAGVRDKVHLLPAHSSFYHPDLVAAASVLIGKAGYSTIAEAYRCGIPFGYVKRARSPESAVLEAFINRHLSSRAISQESYASGRWIETARELLDQRHDPEKGKNAAATAARYLASLLP
jgi:UDP-N-acetylglucosamine:LPS N-acetylglucosamine transferase